MVDRETLIDRIYEAAIAPELWPGVLHDVAKMAGCFGGFLFTTTSWQVSRWVSSPEVEWIMAEFAANTDLQANNMRLQKALAAKYHGFFGNHQLYTENDMKSSYIYTEFFFPKGLGYAVGTALPMPNGDVAIFDLERRYVDGPASDREIGVLDTIRPHLARAAALSTRLNLERANAIVDTLERAGMPAAILGSSQRVLAANAMFQELAKQIVFLAHGKLALADPESNRLLGPALATIGKTESWGSIPLPAVDGAVAAVLHLLPLSRSARDVFNGAHTLLIVTRLDRPAAPTAELLTGLFDLTPSEARVARAFSEGRTTEEAAATLGLSRETIRFYLKGIFAKTGVTRQVDLVALLSGASLDRGGGQEGR